MWEFNQQVFLFFYQFAHQSAFIDAVIVFWAEMFPYILGIAVFLHALRLKNFVKELQELFWIFLPASVAWVVAELMKTITQIPRPFEFARDVSALVSVNDPFGSFPSQHTIFFSALAFSLYLHDERWGIAYVVFALLVGIARIAAGVHWPIDVAAGLLLGQLFGLTFHALEVTIKKVSKK